MQHNRPAHSTGKPGQTARSGFTLVELLVSITILAILTVVTVATLDSTLQSSRVSGASRQIRAAVEGARDRASHANAPRGLRLYYESLEGRLLVHSLSYLETAENETAGTIDVERPDILAPFGSSDADVDEPYILKGTDTNWFSLKSKRLLTENSTIRLGNWWYRIRANGLDNLNLATEEIHITPDYKVATGAPTDVAAGTIDNGDHEIVLEPVEMADETPINLPEGVYIDLSELVDHVKLPISWGTLSAPGHVDIMFSPLGPVEGALSSHGLLQLPIVEVSDVTLGVRFGDPDKEGNESLLTLFTQSGQVTTPPVKLDLSNPFAFAESGVTE